MARPLAPAGLLRNHLRPMASRTGLPRGTAATQLRHKVTQKDEPAAVKRYWVPVGGAALAVAVAVAAAAYAHLTTPRVTVDKARQSDARNPSSTELRDLAAGGEEAGMEVVQHVADQADKSVKEMSGRRTTDQGVFRHD